MRQDFGHLNGEAQRILHGLLNLPGGQAALAVILLHHGITTAVEAIRDSVTVRQSEIVFPVGQQQLSGLRAHLGDQQIRVRLRQLQAGTEAPEQ